MYCNVKKHELRYTDFDFEDKLKLSALLSLMEESACRSADELGFGYSSLQQKSVGFVLVGWHVELYRKICLGEELTIHTWPIQPSRLLIMRDFEFYIGNEKVGVATSRWCVVDLKEFKIVNSSLAFSNEIEYNSKRSVYDCDWKIPRVSNNKIVYSKAVTVSDYDHYNHVNNTKYADFMFDVFSLNELSGKYISNVDIRYHAQCKIGEAIDFYREDFSNYILIEGRVGNSLRVQMKLVLK